MTDEQIEFIQSRTGFKIWREETLSVEHEYVGGPNGGFVLLPLGLRLNRHLENAQVGAALEFINGERARLYAVQRVRCNDAIISGLAMVRYGMSTKELRDKWRRDAVYAGAGLGSIDPEECLVLFYRRKEGF